MKLSMVMVPKSCMTKTLRYRMKTGAFEKLCKRVYAQHAHTCSMCGAWHRPLTVQENWEYSDLERIARLKGLLALCSLCYFARNIGEAAYLAAREELDFRRVQEHFCQVNECSSGEFEGACRTARKLWKRRSRQKWNIELGEYEHLATISLQNDARTT